MNYNKIDILDILTPSGYKHFSGVSKHTVPVYMYIIFTDGTELKCTMGHLLKYKNGEYLESEHVMIGDILFSGHVVQYVDLIESELDVYDIIDVEDVHEYYGNNIVNHNCAFIDDNKIEAIWASAQQTLATGGKCIMLSTPNGVGNFFHRQWVAAEAGDTKFKTIRLPWYVHPDRTQQYRDEADKLLGPRLAAQECDCVFSTSGNTVIATEILDYYEQTYVKEPMQKQGVDGNYWVWQFPDMTKSYLVSCDVARGDGSDYSTITVFETGNMEQVAEYRGQLGTTEFGNFCVSVATAYNDALLVIENSNVGWAAVQTIINRGYRNLFYSSKEELLLADPLNHVVNTYSFNNNSSMTAGFSTSPKVRPLMIAKLDEYLRSTSVIIRSKRLIDELRVFEYKLGKPQARTGYNDDLVLAAAIGLWVRDTALYLRQRNVDNAKSALLGIQQYMPTVQKADYNSKTKLSMPGPHGFDEDISWLI